MQNLAEPEPTIESSSSSTPAILPVTNKIVPSKKKLTLIPLIFLIYFEVAGGPYGEEPAVQAAGPLLAIIGFFVFPFIWSAPEAFITAELSTAFPGNGGYVIWADKAFGPFMGSMMGCLKFLSGVVNVASFPMLMIDYLKQIITALDSGWPRQVAILSSTLFLSVLNYTGLTIVGYVSVVLGIVSVAPFFLLSLIAIPKIKPTRWLSFGERGVKKDWNLFFNTLFWNLNFWDSVSALAGEVDKPATTFPLALLISVIFTCLAYLLPLMAVIGAVNVPQASWESGFHAQAAEMISGKWLKYWIEIGAVFASMGLYEAQLSSCVYQLEGQAELGFIPKFFGLRSRFNTPWVGILLSTGFTIAVSYLDFSDVVASANFMYALSMIVEFAAFIWLRKKMPDLHRPYKVPMNMPCLVIMCLVPTVFLVYVMAIATKIVFIVSGAMTAGSIGWYFLMNYCKEKKVFNYNKPEVEES
ncbi:hypothetical protein ACFE04_027903 [Oxalis oulophora]